MIASGSSHRIRLILGGGINLFGLACLISQLAGRIV